MVPQPSVVPEQSMVLGPSALPEREDIPTTVSDGLVIEILTDQMVDFDESSTDLLEIFTVTGGDKKRDDVNEKKMTDEDRKLVRRAKEAELQSWLDHKVFDVVNKKVADKDRRGSQSGKPRHPSASRGSKTPNLTEVARDSPTLSTSRGLDLTVRGV